MARDYRPVDREQEFLLPPSMADWLPDDHLVWFVIAVVGRLDTSAFHATAKRGGVGRRGYDPEMLLTLFVYAMAHGVSSSRRIERLCLTDVAFRIICAQDIPDHTVLARFRQRHEAALTDLLTESLVLAAELGMVSLGVVAFDGTKIAANASKDANRTEAHLRKLAEKFVEETAQTDAADDARFGADRRGDEPPPDLRDRTRRGERITAALEQIQSRRDAAEQAGEGRAEIARAYDAAVAAGLTRGGAPPRGADRVAVARARLDRERATAVSRWEAWHAQMRSGGGRRPSGKAAVPPEDHSRVRRARAAYEAALSRAEQAAATAKSQTQTDKFVANTTDPQSRLLKTRNGWVQGYNCQTAVSDDEFLVSARATQDTNDLDQFVPTADDVLATAGKLARRTGRGDLTVGVMIGDAATTRPPTLRPRARTVSSPMPKAAP
ncbi:transposase [Amycolatopsis sp. cg5]|uniref:transposase n=1 Tax=Amycolatopsis sp. cg5 TaxID=3238802 RepID=UPI003524D2E5